VKGTSKGALFDRRFRPVKALNPYLVKALNPYPVKALNLYPVKALNPYLVEECV